MKQTLTHTVDTSESAVHLCIMSPILTSTAPSTGVAAWYSPVSIHNLQKTNLDATRQGTHVPMHLR